MTNMTGNLMEFAETVAVNRGLPVRLFSSVSDADKLLLDKDRRGTQRYIHLSIILMGVC